MMLRHLRYFLIRISNSQFRHCEPNGSRECAPDDRLREAIQSTHESWICFVATLLAMTRKVWRIYFAARSRVAICLTSRATIWAASDGGWCEDSDIQVVCWILGRTIGMENSSPAAISWA